MALEVLRKGEIAIQEGEMVLFYFKGFPMICEEEFKSSHSDWASLPIVDKQHGYGIYPFVDDGVGEMEGSREVHEVRVPDIPWRFASTLDEAKTLGNDLLVRLEVFKLTEGNPFDLFVELADQIRSGSDHERLNLVRDIVLADFYGEGFGSGEVN